MTPALRKQTASRRRSAVPDVREDVGRRIRTRREESNLSLRELARRLGISPSAVSQIETGKSRPSADTLYAVIDELGLSADELFSPMGPAVAPVDARRAAAPQTASRRRSAVPDVREDVGRRIRTRREESNLSLRELARRLGISPSAVSQIETGKSRPSADTLYAVIDELGLSADELFSPMGPAAAPAAPAPAAPAATTPDDESPSEPPPYVQRVETRAAIDLDSGVRWERLTPGVDDDVEFLEVVYDAGGSSAQDGRLMRHPGLEYGVVLSGVLELALGFQTYRLRPGDSVRFDATVPHALRNAGDKPARCIWCVVGRHDGD